MESYSESGESVYGQVSQLYLGKRRTDGYIAVLNLARHLLEV